MSDKARWLLVALYAAAMAWVESAVVFYLRVMIDRLEPHQPNPLPMTVFDFGGVELVREAATLIMLLAVGYLAGKTTRARFGYALIAFGVWDILYYVFLIPMTGWPHSLLDWDILFLIPLPWWGPVLAPVSISILMIILGTQLAFHDHLAPRKVSWAIAFLGVWIALYVFMADSIQVIGGGVEAVRTVLPTSFNWLLFFVALILMCAPSVDMGRQMIQNPNFNFADRTDVAGL
ncbi:MAG: hypothetical protein HZB77_14350 [Chloroflexi bacterium]|nr:hypothetical protein [Chloroflexota bacterium]